MLAANCAAMPRRACGTATESSPGTCRACATRAQAKVNRSAGPDDGGEAGDAIDGVVGERTGARDGDEANDEAGEDEEDPDGLVAESDERHAGHEGDEVRCEDHHGGGKAHAIEQQRAALRQLDGRRTPRADRDGWGHGTQDSIRHRAVTRSSERRWDLCELP